MVSLETLVKLTLAGGLKKTLEIKDSIYYLNQDDFSMTNLMDIISSLAEC